MSMSSKKRILSTGSSNESPMLAAHTIVNAEEWKPYSLEIYSCRGVFKENSRTIQKSLTFKATCPG